MSSILIIVLGTMAAYILGSIVYRAGKIAGHREGLKDAFDKVSAIERNRMNSIN